MKKADFIETLKEAGKTEESATALYAKHLDAFCVRFQVDKVFIAKIKKNIELLIEGNKKHKKICEDTIKEVEKESRDDY